MIRKKHIAFYLVVFTIIFILAVFINFADLHHNHTSMNDMDNTCPVTALKVNPMDFGCCYILPNLQIAIVGEYQISDLFFHHSSPLCVLSSRAPPSA